MSTTTHSVSSPGFDRAIQYSETAVGKLVDAMTCETLPAPSPQAERTEAPLPAAGPEPETFSAGPATAGDVAAALARRCRECSLLESFRRATGPDSER